MDANTRDFVETGRQAATETFDQAKDQMSRGMDNAKQYANQAKDAAVQYATKAKHMAHHHIRENPFYAIMIAASVGVAVGLLLAPALRQD